MSTQDVRAPILPVTCQLNGSKTALPAHAGERLLDVLRRAGHCAGVKEGCGEGECGACTVLLDGEAVCSCLALAQTAEGCEVVTVEGLKRQDGTPHPVQTHVVNEMGTQCGFCTPGVILAAAQLLDDKPDATREDILDGISGTLCRCTGCVRIIRAVEKARDEMAESA